MLVEDVRGRTGSAPPAPTASNHVRRAVEENFERGAPVPDTCETDRNESEHDTSCETLRHGRRGSASKSSRKGKSWREGGGQAWCVLAGGSRCRRMALLEMGRR